MVCMHSCLGHQPSEQVTHTTNSYNTTVCANMGGITALTNYRKSTTPLYNLHIHKVSLFWCLQKVTLLCTLLARFIHSF
jgi:hypothetical protein